MTERLLDLRGLRCPWPALRVARALREAPADEIVIAVADDPGAAGEIGTVAARHGWRFVLDEHRVGPALRLWRNAAP